MKQVCKYFEYFNINICQIQIYINNLKIIVKKQCDNKDKNHLNTIKIILVDLNKHSLFLKILNLLQNKMIFFLDTNY